MSGLSYDPRRGIRLYREPEDSGLHVLAHEVVHAFFNAFPGRLKGWEERHGRLVENQIRAIQGLGLLDSYGRVTIDKHDRYVLKNP